MPESVWKPAPATVMQPSGMLSTAARVERGEAQAAGVARSSRAGMNRSVKARPTMRGLPPCSGRLPRIQTLRMPFFSRMVVMVLVLTRFSVSTTAGARGEIDSLMLFLWLGQGIEGRRKSKSQPSSACSVASW